MNTLAHLIEILYGRGGLSDFARDYDIDARRVRGMVASESGYPTPPYLIETLRHEIIAKRSSGNLLGAGSAVARERIGDLIVALQALGLRRHAIVEIIRRTVAEQIERYDDEDALIPLEWHETIRYVGAPPARLGRQITAQRVAAEVADYIAATWPAGAPEWTRGLVESICGLPDDIVGGIVRGD